MAKSNDTILYNMPYTYRILNSGPMIEMRQNSHRVIHCSKVTALEVFEKYFGPGMEGTVHTILDILEDRLAFRA